MKPLTRYENFGKLPESLPREWQPNYAHMQLNGFEATWKAYDFNHEKKKRCQGSGYNLRSPGCGMQRVCNQLWNDYVRENMELNSTNQKWHKRKGLECTCEYFRLNTPGPASITQPCLLRNTCQQTGSNRTEV